MDELDSLGKRLQGIQNLLSSGYKLQIPEEFAIFEDVLLDQAPVKYDFVDREWIGKPGITLERYTDESIAALGRVFIPMLSSGFSGEGAAAVFLLAYHLKAPGSRFRAFVFNCDESLQVMTDLQYSDYSHKMMKNVIPATDDPTREAAVYSYVAASLFRLFSKPASYYVKTWSHVLNGFSKSYGESMKVILPVPTVAAVENLKTFFCGEPRAKVTLYRLLYMSNSDESHKGFKTFLYDNFLKNTGLHIVTIIEQLSDVLNCSFGTIVAAMDYGETKRQVKCLHHVLKMLTENDGNYKMGMWRYGRIFDENFVSDLQTKSCLKVVYVLAEALRSEAPEKHSGILQISQFADISEENKREYAIVSQRLLTYLKNQNPSIV